MAFPFINDGVEPGAGRVLQRQHDARLALRGTKSGGRAVLLTAGSYGAEILPAVRAQ